MKKVSIILPVYNVEKYIKKSIESVLNQTYTDFELLVIIDGSPDNSKQVAEEFTDSRIKIFEKENGGLSDARNYGLERAKGQYVYFMDSDDWIEPNLLEDNLKIIEEENLDVVIFGYIQDDEDIDGNILSSQAISPGNAVFLKKNNDLILDRNRLGIMGYAWNKIYRKSFLVNHHLVFEKGTSLVEDILFNSQVYSLTETLRFNEKTYYHYINRQVVTLMKIYHPNAFELKKRKTSALELFFDKWTLKNKNQFLAESSIQGIRYCIHNMFSFKNQLSFIQKAKLIREMLSDDTTRKYIHHYRAIGSSNKLYKFLIQNNQALIIATLALIRK